MTTRKPVVIDADFYPHIMDEIWANVDYVGMLRLRATYREYQEYVDGLLLDHCRVTAVQEQNLMTHSREVIRSADGHRVPLLHRLDPSSLWHSHTKKRAGLERIRILDVLPDCTHIVQLDRPHSFDLNVVRTCEIGDTEIPIMLDLRVATHVHFTSLKLSTEVEMCFSKRPQKLVLHVQYDMDLRSWTRDYLYTRPDESALQTMVVIFEKPPTPDISEAALALQAHDIGHVVRMSMWKILFLSIELWACGTSHTLILVDFEPLWRLTLPKSDTPASSRRVLDSIRGYVKAKYDEHQNSAPSTSTLSGEALDACIPKIKLVDSARYRKVVGEEMWQLETDRSALLPVVASPR